MTEGDLIVNIDALGREKLHLCVGDVIELSPYIDNGHTPQSVPVYSSVCTYLSEI